MRRVVVLSALVVLGVVVTLGRTVAQGNVAEIEQVKRNLYVITGGGGNTAALVTDDGVVVVPAVMAERVLEIAAEREEVEQVIKKELRKNPGSPGKYYPFNDATWKLFEEYKSRGQA